MHPTEGGFPEVVGDEVETQAWFIVGAMGDFSNETEVGVGSVDVRDESGDLAEGLAGGEVNNAIVVFNGLITGDADACEPPKDSLHYLGIVVLDDILAY